LRGLDISQVAYTFAQSPQKTGEADLENAPRHRSPNLFDNYAHRYEGVLNRALSPSGETRPYFARQRILWLHNQLQAIGFKPSRVLDYGCGTGGSVPFLMEILRPRGVLGVDVSGESLIQARSEHGGEGIEFANLQDYQPRSEFQLAFCNGVFHHIAPTQRPAALRYIYDSLVPGGIFALWENNPWNPATCYITGRCEFDNGAMPISSARARKLLCRNSFQVLKASSHFYFPRWLKWLRPLEPTLARLPLGAQYMLLARKPA
jgi:SAM-dependent methyltransferase